jgi:hypothetical protein
MRTVRKADLLERVAGSARGLGDELKAALEASDAEEFGHAVGAGGQLRHTYKVRRELLADRGVGVGGIDALLAIIEARPSRQIGILAVEREDGTVVAFFDEDQRLLVGEVIVPRDLPPPP